MRWSTYISSRDGAEHVALVEDGHLYALAGTSRLVELLGDDGERLAAAGERARSDPFEVVGLDEAVLRAPVPVPPSIRDFMAFEEHVVNASRGLGHKLEAVWYEQPLFYFTNPAAVRGPRDNVEIAPGSNSFDYELEIAAVIGRGGCDLDPAQAAAHIAGYLILCDWSARDLQAIEMKGNLGPAKGKDSATSLGPYLVTPDELSDLAKGNAYDLEMTASVNGVEWSRGNFSTIYWSFSELLAYASRGTELRPGDLIGSGTVGSGCILELSAVNGHDRYPWLVPGDDVRLAVDRLGVIESQVRLGRPVVPLR